MNERPFYPSSTAHSIMGQNPRNPGLRSGQDEGTYGRSVGFVGQLENRSEARTWPGQAWGIRQPRPGETPLSWAEVEIALREVMR